MNDRLRGTRTKKYVGFVTGAAVVVGAAVTVALAQPWADGPVQSTPAPPVRYVGVHQPDAPNSYYEVQQFAQAIGTQPNLVSYYSRWRESFQVSFATLAKDHGALPLVQIAPQGVSLAAIAAGRDDGYLRSYAAAVKAFGADTVAVLACPEMGDFRLRRLAWELEKTGTDLCVSPALLDVAGPRTTIRSTAGLTLLHVDHPQLSGGRLVIK